MNKNSLVRSNRNNELNKVLEPEKKLNVQKLAEQNHNKTSVESVTFDTNLKISNHSRNKLQSMANLGFATNQKNAIEVALDAYIDSLSDEEKKEIQLQIKTLENKDVRLYQNRKNK
ncbi:DUF5388 domain-containing protein [uncultured Vagococcus sp.]|uniref:DUF5388 domain-containing protein n=1 Tax=uncultured Vagococcus sp. TaxID=189676 RepID=UPI00258EC392|nr:DUF5388 domain-containing protein [uncultured Vagococcus sp.]